MSDKVKIIDIAADIARTPKEVFEKAKELGLDVKNTTSSVDVKTAEILAEFVTTGVNKMPPPPKPKAAKSSTKATKTTKTATKTTKTDKPAAKKSPKPKESPDTPNDVKEIKSSKNPHLHKPPQSKMPHKSQSKK